jgi:hypothetical protein
MSSTAKLDRAIIAIVEARQPCSMKQIMQHIEKDHNAAGRSLRPVTERVYALKREGKLALSGVKSQSLYTLPDYHPETKRTEAQQQAVEGARREATPMLSAPVVVVEDPEGDLPAGWTTLREQMDDWDEAEQAITTTAPPIAQRAPLSLSISALAGDVAAQVAMTVERVIGQDIRRYEAVIADLQKQLEQQTAELARMSEELKAAEQLGNEAEQKYNGLREKLRSL